MQLEAMHRSRTMQPHTEMTEPIARRRRQTKRRHCANSQQKNSNPPNCEGDLNVVDFRTVLLFVNEFWGVEVEPCNVSLTSRSGRNMKKNENEHAPIDESSRMRVERQQQSSRRLDDSRTKPHHHETSMKHDESNTNPKIEQKSCSIK